MSLFDGWLLKKANPDAERNHLNKILQAIRDAITAAVDGSVHTVVPGAGIDVDATDPNNPVVSVEASIISGAGLGATALQPGDNVSELINDAGYITAELEHLPGSTYETIQDFVNVMHSPGLISGGEFSNATGGTMDVAAGTIMIRSVDDNVSTLYFADFPATTVSIPADSLARYIGVERNGVSPQVIVKTTNTWDQDTEFPLGTCANNGTVMFPFYNPFKVGDPITNVIQRFDAQSAVIRDASVGGMLLADVATRTATLSAGVAWHRLNDTAITAKNSGTQALIGVRPGPGGTVQLTPGLTQWPNTQYTDPTGTLVTMGNNKWAVLWFFVNVGSNAWGFAYGTDEYNNASSAQQETIPSYLSNAFLANNLLVGRMLFEKSNDTPIVESAFTRVFNSAAVADHNQLSNLQGGQLNEYYHLTAAQHTPVAQIGSLADPGTNSLLYWNDATNQYAYTTFTADAQLLMADADVPRLGTVNTWPLAQTFTVAPVFTATANTRTALGATAVGSNIFTLANPGVVTWIRINADNSVSARSAANTRTDLGATTVGSALFTVANPSAIRFIRINADNSVTLRTAAEQVDDIGAQPLDATLTALAGANWSLNSFPIGTGPDTLSQVAFAANTFPARASTGDLVAKAITNGGLSVLAGTSGTTTFLRGDGTASDTLTGPITSTRANVNSGADTVTNGGLHITGVTSGSAVYGTSSVGRGIIECSQTGNTNLDFDSKPADGTSVANVRVFRNTATTGIARAQYFIGDMSGTLNAQIAGKGDDTYFCANNGNFSLFGSGSFGSGTKVTFIGNSTVVPTTNPTGGGVLYSESGSLKFRESGGTITTMASSGTYTATSTAVTNVSATSASADFMYTRVGNIVHVSGTASITPTAAGGASIRVSLPIASNFTASTQASGVMVGTNGAVREAGHVSADTVNDQLSLNFAPTLTTAYNVRFEATYQVV